MRSGRVKNKSRRDPTCKTKTEKISVRSSFDRPSVRCGPSEKLGRHLRSRFRCSMCSAVRMDQRTLLRSSSIHEPSDPPFRVVYKTTYSFSSLFFSNPPKQMNARAEKESQKENVPINTRTRIGVQCVIVILNSSYFIERAKGKLKKHSVFNGIVSGFGVLVYTTHTHATTSIYARKERPE